MAKRVNGIERTIEGVHYILTDTGSDKYPENSPCPKHGRQHNAHGWYVCLTLMQIFDAFGSVVVTNNGEFYED